MRLIACLRGGDRVAGVRVEGGVVPTGYSDILELIRDEKLGLARAQAAAESGAGAFEPDRLLAPLAPPKLLFCGVNYRSHAEENPDAVIPDEPFIFAKLPSAVIGPGEPIVIPSAESQVDYEVELAFVMGRRAARVPRERALEHVFGYTVVNDVSARDVQFRNAQITLGKGFDSFCPLGPELVLADEIPDPRSLHVRAAVNGEERQSSPTSEMIFGVDALIEFISRSITLEPGDLVTTGTPAGVGLFRRPPSYLQPGDVVTVEVDRIGPLTNPVVAAPS